MTGPVDGVPILGFGNGRHRSNAHRFSHSAMATVFEVHCVHADALYVRQAAQAAFELVDRLERELSRFIANSDISRINLLAKDQSTRVSPWTMECLEIAMYLHRLTAGTFDISLGSRLERLELVQDEYTVRAREAGASLDLGGIGKGYAVDRMAELMEEWDLPHTLVHGGFSSVRALEAPPAEEGWPLTLSAPGPEVDRVLSRISARRLAFSASGVRKGDHIVDPRSGRPARGREAAWVAVGAGGDCHQEGLSPAAVADGLSTAFMLLDLNEVGDICRDNPELEAWVLSKPQEGQPAPTLVHFGEPGSGVS